MKKFLLFLFIIFNFGCARADFIPQYSESVKNWGIGGVFVGKEFSIYELRNENSRAIAKIKWDENGNIACKGKCADYNMFVYWLPSRGYAILSAVDVYDDENEENAANWAKIYYGPNDALAWIKLDGENKFITWQDLITTYGKKHGFYLFKDIKKEERRLFAQPQDGSKAVDSWEYAKIVTPWFVKGNWMMVKVLNFDNVQKTGWFKWRTSEGRLRGFVDLKN